MLNVALSNSDEEDLSDDEENGESSVPVKDESDSFEKWNRIKEFDGVVLGNEYDNSEDRDDNYEGEDIAVAGLCEPLPYPTGAAAAVPHTSASNALTMSSSTSSSSSSAALQSSQQVAASTDISPTSPPAPRPDTERSALKKEHSVSRVSKSGAKIAPLKPATVSRDAENSEPENVFDAVARKMTRNKK